MAEFKQDHLKPQASKILDCFKSKTRLGAGAARPETAKADAEWFLKDLH